MDLPEIDRLVAINQKWSVSTIMLPVIEVAAMSALIKKQEQALADKDLVLLEQVELVTAQVAVVDRLTLELAARQPLADSFVAPGVTVDTQEVVDALRAYNHDEIGTVEAETLIKKWCLANTARAVAAAEKDGYVRGYAKASLEGQHRRECVPEPEAQPVAGELPQLPTGAMQRMADDGLDVRYEGHAPVQPRAAQPVKQPAAVGRVVHGAVPGGGWYAHAQWSGQVPSDGALLYTAPVAGVQGDADLVKRLTHERDTLGQAIADAALKAGMYNGAVDLSGPHLIMFAQHLGEAAKPQPDSGRSSVQGDKLSEQKLADRLAGTSAMSPKDRRTLLNGDPVPFTLPQLTHIANLLTKDFALQTLSDISQIQEAASQPDSGRDAALVLPGCLADRLYEAIGIARERAQHAGSVERRKKWEATRADLQAALAAHPANGAQAEINAALDRADAQDAVRYPDGARAGAHSIGHNDDLPEGWKRHADGRVEPPVGEVGTAYIDGKAILAAAKKGG